MGNDATTDEHGIVPAETLPPNMVEEWSVDGTTRTRYVRYLTVHECIGRVLAELPAIGRDSQAPQAIGGFKFRGIEAVKDALNPLLAKYGVFYVPEVLERIMEEDRGKEHVVALHVRYTFFGPAGDSVSGSMWGEGMDTRDKGHQKAATAAEKYMLFQVLAIATNEQSGDDVDGAEPPKELPPASKTEMESIRARLAARVADPSGAPMHEGGVYPLAWVDGGGLSAKTLGRILDDTDETTTTAEHAAEMRELLDAMDRDYPMGHVGLNQANDDAAASDTPPLTPAVDPAGHLDNTEEDGKVPCELCGSTRAARVVVQGVWRCANPKDCARRAEERAAAETATPDPDAPMDCAGCGEPITDGPPVFDADDQPWHLECAPPGAHSLQERGARMGGDADDAEAQAREAELD